MSTKPIKNNLRLIVWDLDGTLVDSGRVILESFQYALKPYGIAVGHQDIERVRSAPPERVFESFVGPEQAPMALQRLNEFAYANADAIKPYEGVTEILEGLRLRGIRMAVWTGRPTAPAVDILKVCKIHHYFERIVGGCLVEQNKPAPDGLKLILDSLEITAEQALVIGDHAHDIIGATSQGAHSAHALWGTPPGTIREQNASLAFNSPQDMALWLFET